MYQKVSVAMILFGLLFSAGSLFLASGHNRIILTTLGLIIACGSCLTILANARGASQYKPFIMIVSFLFIILVIGFVVKALTN